jgi:hypothetical protein
MATARGRDLVIVAVALVVAALAVVGVILLRSQGSAGGSAVSRGEAIFQSGTDANGDLIRRSSSGTGMMGGGMMGGGMMGGYYQSEKCQKFLDETAELRKELYNKRVEYSEAYRNPKITAETIVQLEREIYDLQKKIYTKAPLGCGW